jgi:V8-like Glu-specific endopeptidase
MRVAPIGPFRSTPSQSTSGIVWTQSIIVPRSVDRIRVHLVVTQDQNPSTWTIVFKDLSGVERDRIEGNSFRGQTGEIWSDDIPGSGAIIQLFTTSVPVRIEVTIDKYAYSIQPTYPQAIWGTDDRRPIKGVSSTIQQWGKPVARLRIMMLQGEALCTGFLVSGNLLLTNQHCIKNSSEALSTRAEFGYDDFDSTPDRYSASLELVNSDGTGLDYALIRLSGKPGEKYGHVLMDRPDPTFVLADQHPLIIIEHPGGLPKEVSIKDCAVSGSQIAGIELNRATDFGHHCDTLGGSSGSPVFDFETGKVVGLHHMGFTAASHNLDNQGIYLWRVLQDISGQSPSIFQELIGSAH